MSRVLDGLFAERVMGLTLFDKVSESDGLATYRTHEPKCYTTELTAAWGGVERLVVDGWPGFALRLIDDGPLLWYAVLERREAKSAQASELSPALAVVLACLRAVGVSEEEIAAAQGEAVDV